MRTGLHVATTVIALFLCTFYIVMPVLASGVGFTPGKLEFHDGSGNLQNTLYVINTGKETANYQVYIDEDYTDWFSISPNHFSLAPNDNMPVQISLSDSEIPVGDYNIKLSVIAFANWVDAKVGTGAKVPVHISITSSVPKPSEEQLSELPIELTESLSLSAEESSDSPVRVELWIGLIIALAVVTVTAFAFVRRRRSVGTS